MCCSFIKEHIYLSVFRYIIPGKHQSIHWCVMYNLVSYLILKHPFGVHVFLPPNESSILHSQVLCFINQIFCCYLLTFFLILLQAVISFVTMQLQLCSVFFTFSLGTRTHYFGRTILHGGARVYFFQALSAVFFD